MHRAVVAEIKDDIAFGQLSRLIKYARQQKGVIDHIRIGKGEDTCLIHLAREKSPQLLTDMESLLQTGVDPNGTSESGFTPLLAAVRAPKGGSFEMGTDAAKMALAYTETLVKYGADVNQCDDQGMSALSWAAWAGHTGLVDLLISKGAVQDVDPRKKDHISPLHYAAIADKPDVLDIMVHKHGFDVDYFSNQTALHFVVQNDNFSSARKLVELGAQIDMPDSMTGRTVRDMLYVKGWESLIDMHDEILANKMRADFERAQNLDKILAEEEMQRVKEIRQVISKNQRPIMIKRRR